MILTDNIAVYICDHSFLNLSVYRNQEKLNKHGNLVFQKI